jgi:hypothetical protein
MARYFGYKHKKSQIWTGEVCWDDHHYQPPAEPGGVGLWVGRQCAHPETDGDIFEDHLAWWEEFVWWQHDH